MKSTTISTLEFNILRLLITKYRLDKSSSIIRFAQQNNFVPVYVMGVIKRFEKRGLVTVIRKKSHSDIVLVTDKAVMYYNLRKLSAKLYNEELKSCADMFEKIHSDFKILMGESK